MPGTCRRAVRSCDLIAFDSQVRMVSLHRDSTDRSAERSDINVDVFMPSLREVCNQNPPPPPLSAYKRPSAYKCPSANNHPQQLVVSWLHASLTHTHKPYTQP